MKSLLIVGAGKSATYLIDYLLLLANTSKKNWNVTVADADLNNLKHKTKNYPKTTLVALDINNTMERQELVKKADIIISLMPPQLHILLAKDCIIYKKNIITSSYVSTEMKELNQAAINADVSLICEMGLDPGIDHMSACKILNNIKSTGGTVQSFKSYCGGLVAPECDNNPWHYKFSWNPINIINAGKEGSRFIENGKEKNILYKDIFAQNKNINCDGIGELAYYANRDSISYIPLYELDGISDFIRATLRYPSFNTAWNELIKLGLTNTEDNIDTDNLSYENWIAQLTKYNFNTTISLKEHVWKLLNIEKPEVKMMIEWLGIFSDKIIAQGLKSSGLILLEILKQKWVLASDDKDMIVMQHEIEYLQDNKRKKVISSLIVKGENSDFSAMAKTVGMPMAILAEVILSGEVKVPYGVHIPIIPEIYNPVLKGLEKIGIVFKERTIEF